MEARYELPAGWLNDDRLGDPMDIVAPHLLRLKGEIARTVARRLALKLGLNITNDGHIPAACRSQAQESIEPEPKLW